MEHYRKALARTPEAADVLNNLGAALVLLERLSEAVAHYREAVRLNPASDEVRENLQRALTAMRRNRAGRTP